MNAADSTELFLVSNDSYDLSGIRACLVLRTLTTPTRKDLVLVSLEPGIVRSGYGLEGSIAREAILAGRFQNRPFSSAGPWPMFVTVSVLDESPDAEVIDDEDFGYFLGLGLVFSRFEDAENARHGWFS
jgi:hypothetical protein